MCHLVSDCSKCLVCVDIWLNFEDGGDRAKPPVNSLCHATLSVSPLGVVGPRARADAILADS